jgi:lipopolysaccharide/colanic/teichoic acid biosynthesis glycosyltransferase
MRSMRADGTEREAWSVKGDGRVTTVGRFMRKTHLDELPQLFNVLRGDMSLVGPRPEQSSLVKYLEDRIPYYDRRHLVRPGITGWAQVQCGYAGSDLGSTLKACYDLYYIRHRSAGLDFGILLETIRTLVADRQWPILQSLNPFVLSPGPYAANSADVQLPGQSVDGRATPAGAV